MHFSQQEREQLLLLKYVGTTVIERLEQIGIHSFEQLAKERYEDICAQVATLVEAAAGKIARKQKRRSTPQSN